MAQNLDTAQIAAAVAAAMSAVNAQNSEAAEEAIAGDEELELEESSRSSYQKDAESGAI